jgi:hypothetical protein
LERVPMNLGSLMQMTSPPCRYYLIRNGDKGGVEVTCRFAQLARISGEATDLNQVAALLVGHCQVHQGLAA